MKIKVENENILLSEIDSFNIEHILECGQCFRFEKITEGEYLIIAHRKLLRVKQMDKELIIYNTSKEEFDKLWKVYFDLDNDYGYIKNQLVEIDETLKDSIEVKNGIRILKQDLWEMIISFIISQNKQIPHIKKIIKTISEQYGDAIGQWGDTVYYSFPTPERLAELTEEALRECKTGFRAPYILDASLKVANGELDLEALTMMPTEEVKKQLLTIKGVGNKIADCVLLYGMGRSEVFPTDVWIKRIVEHLYLKEEAKVDKIQAFATEKFGALAGYAQQYLFYYGRENKIGK